MTVLSSTSSPPQSPQGRVVIIGGGLAGIAAAAALRSAGLHVTLVEARKGLGGRAGSFIDPHSGVELDNCQHVLLGCCTNLRDLYSRLGVADRIQWHRAIRFLDADGRAHDLQAIAGWPAPLHLGPSMLSFGLLRLRERAAVCMAMAAMLRLGRTGRESLADLPFGQWLDEHGQPPSLLSKFYDPILISALNEETRRVSAAGAIQVFQEAMLANREGYLLGVPSCPLAELYRHVPCDDLLLGRRVMELIVTADRVTGVHLADGQDISADAVILSTNHHAATKLLPDTWRRRDSRLSRLGDFESVPILGAHFWFDRPVMQSPHGALVTGPLQWLFRKDAAGVQLHGVISAARAWANQPRERILPILEAQLRSLLPASRGAKLERAVVVIEKRATFAPLPGVDRDRPSQAPPPAGLQRLFLAGDYTKTDWPATMEGAVRSGYLAAQEAAALLLAARPVPKFLVPDLTLDWPARLAGLGR